MDAFYFLIVAFVLLKIFLWVCIYAYRAHRITEARNLQRQQLQCIRTCIAAQQHSDRAVIIDHEALPAQSELPAYPVVPPPYTEKQEDPPPYEQAVGRQDAPGQVAAPTNTQVAAPTSIQVGAPPTAPEANESLSNNYPASAIGQGHLLQPVQSESPQLPVGNSQVLTLPNNPCINLAPVDSAIPTTSQQVPSVINGQNIEHYAFSSRMSNIPLTTCMAAPQENQNEIPTIPGPPSRRAQETNDDEDLLIP